MVMAKVSPLLASIALSVHLDGPLFPLLCAIGLLFLRAGGALRLELRSPKGLMPIILVS